MSIFDGEEVRPASEHQIGQPLDGLSVSDLRERIARLRAEIERLEADMESKNRTRTDAELAFKPSMGGN